MGNSVKGWMTFFILFLNPREKFTNVQSGDFRQKRTKWTDIKNGFQQICIFKIKHIPAGKGDGTLSLLHQCCLVSLTTVGALNYLLSHYGDIIVSSVSRALQSSNRSPAGPVLLGVTDWTCETASQSRGDTHQSLSSDSTCCTVHTDKTDSSHRWK